MTATSHSQAPPVSRDNISQLGKPTNETEGQAAQEAVPAGGRNPRLRPNPVRCGLGRILPARTRPSDCNSQDGFAPEKGFDVSDMRQDRRRSEQSLNKKNDGAQADAAVSRHP